MKKHDAFHYKIIIFVLVVIIVFFIGLTININRNKPPSMPAAAGLSLEQRITELAKASPSAQEVIRKGNYTSRFSILSAERVLTMKQESPEGYGDLPDKQLYQVDILSNGAGYRIILDESEIYKEIFLSKLIVGK
jgi:hypothetical protein